jgi:hypothetical protein
LLFSPGQKEDEMMNGRITVVAAALAGALLAVPAAHAGVIRTPALVPPPGGWLSCTVTNLTTEPLDLDAALLSDARTIVTDFVSTTWQDEAGLIPDTFVLESMQPDARRCQVGVSGGRRHDVMVVLEAFDDAGVRTGVVTVP